MMISVSMIDDIQRTREKMDRIIVTHLSCLKKRARVRKNISSSSPSRRRKTRKREKEEKKENILLLSTFASDDDEDVPFRSHPP